MQLTELGKKYLRRLIFVCGVLLGFGSGFVVCLKVAPPQYVTSIEDNSKTKNRDSQSESNKDFKNETDNSKKKEKKKFLFW